MNSGNEPTNSAPATAGPDTTNSAVAPADTAATLITNIAGLVTNDPSLGDGSPSD